ncbi:MAG: c-type cytochrome [Panacagrimonas sp.]
MIKHIVLAGLGAALSLSVAAETAVPEKAVICAACHGEGGGKPILPEYPVLAGQYFNYLAHAMHEYKDGKRKNPIMAAQASPLSDADIKALAQYFSQQPTPLYTPRIPEHKAR